MSHLCCTSGQDLPGITSSAGTCRAINYLKYFKEQTQKHAVNYLGAQQHSASLLHSAMTSSLCAFFQ